MLRGMSFVRNRTPLNWFSDMAIKTDPITAACLQLASSTEVMRAAAKTYLGLAEQTEISQDRKAFLQCAAFYAQLAEELENDARRSPNLRMMN